MALHPMLVPFGTADGESFTVVHARHLLNRAGFGGTPEEVQQVMKLGPVSAIDAMLGFPDAPAQEQTPDDLPDFSSLDEFPRSDIQMRQRYQNKTEDERREIRQQFQKANRQALTSMTTWWFQRMVNGRFPLQEKLTLFWHGHFTTSARDERKARLMWQQNELLRRQSAGQFKQFVLDISRDPAMLDYLNNNQSRKQHPNENYARELMELFTLGIGNYTEDDVKAAARAFTGWGHDGDQFVFRRRQHDNDSKTFLGAQGNLDGTDIIDTIFRQPACATFICQKLYSFFIKETPDKLLVNSLASLLRDKDWDLRAVLKTMLSSRIFYRDDAIGQQIKSPVQLIVGTLRMLNLPVPAANRLTGALAQMGQVPFFPPNVKGWAGGQSWINTSTLLVRYNTAISLVSRVNPAGLPNDADGLIQRLIGRPVDDDKRRTLDQLLKADRSPGGVRKAIALIVAMPEYQLC